MELNRESAYKQLVITTADNRNAQTLLADLTPQQVLSRTPRDSAAAQCLLAGLWLWHDGLEEAHRLVQPLSDATAAWWHAIMHRRQGDFDNAKYWYARCTDHPALPAVTPQAALVLNPMLADTSLLRLLMPAWNPDAFVDLVAKIHPTPEDPRYPIAVVLQQIEWQVLFDHCRREA